MQLFAQLRRDDPVHYCEASAFGPYWSVTRYDDIFQVELDHDNYSSSSELGGTQIADQPRGQEITSFLRMDPPGHTAQRRTVAPVVAPSNPANLEALIRKRTSDVLDALPRNETFDWVGRVSTDLTNMMLATLFDFPWQDRAKLTWWSDVAIANVDSPDAVVHSQDERFAELTRMGEYFRKLWDTRADAPPTFDLISMLAHSEATRNLQPREFIGTMALLIRSDGRIFSQIVGCSRRCPADVRPDLDARAFGSDPQSAAARIHRHDGASDRRRQRHHAQFHDRRADGAGGKP